MNCVDEFDGYVHDDDYAEAEAVNDQEAWHSLTEWAERVAEHGSVPVSEARAYLNTTNWKVAL